RLGDRPTPWPGTSLQRPGHPFAECSGPMLWPGDLDARFGRLKAVALLKRRQDMSVKGRLGWRVDGKRRQSELSCLATDRQRRFDPVASKQSLRLRIRQLR